MIVVGKEMLYKFSKKHTQSQKPLMAWFKIVSESTYNDFNYLRKSFPSADYVYHRYIIFNIAGNKYLLITIIDYHAQTIVIKSVWTHAEYSLSKNQDALRKVLL